MTLSITAKFKAAKNTEKMDSNSEGLAGPFWGKNTLTCSAAYSSDFLRWCFDSGPCCPVTQFCFSADSTRVTAFLLCGGAFISYKLVFSSNFTHDETPFHFIAVSMFPDASFFDSFGFLIALCCFFHWCDSFVFFSNRKRHHHGVRDPLPAARVTPLTAISTSPPPFILAFDSTSGISSDVAVVFSLAAQPAKEMYDRLG